MLIKNGRKSINLFNEQKKYSNKIYSSFHSNINSLILFNLPINYNGIANDKNIQTIIIIITLCKQMKREWH